MNIDEMLKQVTSINEYISVTQEVANIKEISKMQFNMSAVLCLKKVRALEIEYFNKCEGKGAASIILERMLEIPPSKTWGLLGKELVSLLQYWLEAMRKHLIKHNQSWWNFLKLLLQYIRSIRTKDESLPNMLVECTAECLLDIATNSKPDNVQRHEILYCLNLFCAESGRDCRMALRSRLEKYLTNLSTILVNCGHLPTQFSALETLLRWVLPRQDQTVRRNAANKWFPEEVCGRNAVQIFLTRPWLDFFKDARDFLNACNDSSKLVYSVLCRKIVIGSVNVVFDERRDLYLDINTSDKSVSVQLDPRTLDALRLHVESWETLVLLEPTLHSVKLYKEISEVVLCFNTTLPFCMYPSGTAVGDSTQLKAVVSSKGISRLDEKLRELFTHRYEILLDLNEMLHYNSPNVENKQMPSHCDSMEEDTRFSLPGGVQKRKHSGFIVRSRHPGLWKSPSTASTSSIAQLQEKLATLPRYKFEKEAVQVCALPELSTVTEVSETDDRQSLSNATTVNLKVPFGVCQKKIKNYSQSDGEMQGKSKTGRCISPVVKDDENSTSCLLVATIGSADESVINDTLERLSKSKDFQGDNIVDLLVREALQNGLEKDFLDSGINTGDNKKSPKPKATEITESTSAKDQTVLKKADCEKSCTVISNTTTDESNDVVYDTPFNYVSTRKKKKKNDNNTYFENDTHDPQTFNAQTVEKFFSQHLSENERDGIVISPTLARKINESSSESDHFDDVLDAQNNALKAHNNSIHEPVISDCLNNIIDNICEEQEIYTEVLPEAPRLTCGKDLVSQINILKDTTNTLNTSIDETKLIKSKKNIRLKYPTKKKSRMIMKGNERKKEVNTPNINLAPIMETSEIVPKTPEQKKISPNQPEQHDITSARKKRKLYSPKDDNIEKENTDVQYKEIKEDDDFKNATTPLYKATCYKDIENERQKRTRKPRNTRSRAKLVTPPSPRTKKKNDIFDRLKDKVESNDSVIFADKKRDCDLAIFNFTSDSEDENFKKKKVEIQKRISSGTVANENTPMTTRRNRKVNRVNYSENKSSDESKCFPSRPKRRVRRKKSYKQSNKNNTDLIDQTMRKALTSAELDTSLVMEIVGQQDVGEPSFTQREHHKMEPIPDETIIGISTNDKAKKKAKQIVKKDVLSLKKEKEKLVVVTDDNRTESPLPGLLVETMPINLDDSISTNVLQKLKKFQQEGTEASYNNTNTSQNLLSDIDRINGSPPLMNITDEYNQIESCYNIKEDKTKTVRTRRSKPSHPDEKSTNSINLQLADIASPVKNRSNESKCPKRILNESRNIDNIDMCDSKSDKSIVTVGKSPITAHGDSSEKPPNSKQLTQKLAHRNLELDCLDQSMKDYFTKLNNDINSLSSLKDVSRHSNSNKKSNASLDKSPVLSISRISYDDISKWLPSRRSSETDSSSVSEVVTKRSEIHERSNLQDPDNNLGKISQKSKSPEPKYTRNNKESILRDIITDAEEIVQSAVEERRTLRSKKKNIDNQEKEIIANKKYLRSDRRCVMNNDSGFNLQISPVEFKNKDETPKTLRNVRSPMLNKKSIISPIKLFDGETFPLLSKEKSTTYVRLDNRSNSSKNVETSKKFSQSKNIKNNLKSDKDKLKEISSLDSEVSTSTRLDRNIKTKRKSDRLARKDSKRQRLNESVLSLSDSGPSMSSVNEWFKRNAPVSRVESVNASLSESIQCVMEKLDTTLAEIHQNTSQKFIHMFVDVQQELSAVRERRREIYRSAASEIISTVVKVIDEKFAALDQRSQEVDASFMNQLKVQASQLIREDCKKKQVMVTLLREDLRAVLDHAQKK